MNSFMGKNGSKKKFASKKPIFPFLHMKTLFQGHFSPLFVH